MPFRDLQYGLCLTTTMYDSDHQHILDQQQIQHQLQDRNQLQLEQQQQLQLQNLTHNSPHGNLYQPSPRQQPTPSADVHYRHTSVSRCSQRPDDNQSIGSNSTEPQHSPSSMQIEIKQKVGQQQQYPIKIEDTLCFGSTSSTDNLIKMEESDIDNGTSFQEEFDFTIDQPYPQYNGRVKALSLPSSTSIANDYQQSSFHYNLLPSNTEYLGNEARPFASAADAATVINYNQLENELPINGNDNTQFQQQSFISNGSMVSRSNGFEAIGNDNSPHNQHLPAPPEQPRLSQRVSQSSPLGSPLTVQSAPNGVNQRKGNFINGIDATLAGNNTPTRQGDASSNVSLEEGSNNSYQAHTPTANTTNNFNLSSSSSLSSAQQPNGIATLTKSRLQSFSGSKSPSLSPLTNELRQLPTTPTAQPLKTPLANKQKKRKISKVKTELEFTATLNSFSPSPVAPPSGGETSSSAATSYLSTPIPTSIPTSTASLLRRNRPGRPRVKSAHNVIEQRYRNKINNKFNALQESVPTLKVLLLRKLQEKQRLRLQQQNGEFSDSAFGAGGSGAGDDSLSDNEDFNSFEGMDLQVLDDKEIESIDLEGLEPARKLNKGTILAKSIEYIKFLESKNDKLKQDHDALLNKVRLMGFNFDDDVDSSMS